MATRLDVGRPRKIDRPVVISAKVPTSLLVAVKVKRRAEGGSLNALMVSLLADYVSGLRRNSHTETAGHTDTCAHLDARSGHTDMPSVVTHGCRRCGHVVSAHWARGCVAGCSCVRWMEPA